MGRGFWTYERVERLEELWDRPYSTAEIAKLLGASKSAVCGKAWRLGLPARPPIKPQRRRKSRGKSFELRQKKPAAPRLAVVRVKRQHDFSWHLEQVRRQGEARAITPPEGKASWRTFRRAAADDPALKAALDRARQDRKDDGWIRRKKAA